MHKTLLACDSFHSVVIAQVIDRVGLDGKFLVKVRKDTGFTDSLDNANAWRPGEVTMM